MRPVFLHDHYHFLTSSLPLRCHLRYALKLFSSVPTPFLSHTPDRIVPLKRTIYLETDSPHEYDAPIHTYPFSYQVYLMRVQ